jgi:hypothetical protein
MQSRGMRRSVAVNHGKGSCFCPDGVNYQRITFIMTNRIPIPGRRYIRRMRMVQPYLSKFIVRVKYGDLPLVGAFAFQNCERCKARHRASTGCLGSDNLSRSKRFRRASLQRRPTAALRSDWCNRRLTGWHCQQARYWSPAEADHHRRKLAVREICSPLGLDLMSAARRRGRRGGPYPREIRYRRTTL